MPEIKHTPGPWRASHKHTDAVVSDNRVRDVDDVAARHYYGGYLICESVAPENRPILAVAPEMYDVLASIENDGGQVPEWLWNRIQEVLAKARGER
jgi:hypothetical protein